MKGTGCPSSSPNKTSTVSHNEQNHPRTHPALKASLATPADTPSQRQILPHATTTTALTPLLVFCNETICVLTYLEVPVSDSPGVHVGQGFQHTSGVEPVIKASQNSGLPRIRVKLVFVVFLRWARCCCVLREKKRTSF